MPIRMASNGVSRKITQRSCHSWTICALPSIQLLGYMRFQLFFRLQIRTALDMRTLINDLAVHNMALRLIDLHLIICISKSVHANLKF